MFDGRLRLTVILFLSRYRNMQLPFDENPDPAVWSYVVRNAPRAQTYGAEFGATWAATRALSLSADIGLLHTEVTRYANSGVEGNELARAPKLSAAFGMNWRAANRFEVGATARYSSAYHSAITNIERGRVEPGWIANVRASYPVGAVKLFAFVNNVFDSGRPVLLEADPNAADASGDGATLHRPRTIGVGLEAWF